MAKYLNESGLTVLWGNIKNYFPSVKHAVDGTATLNTNIAAGNLATFAIDDNNNVSLQGIALTALPVNSHAHGNITNGGAITATGVDIANGDALTIVDSSASGKLVKSDITFDGSTTSQFLTKKGDWGTALTSHQSLGLITATSGTGTSENTTDQANPFVVLLGGGAAKDSIQFIGAGSVSIKGKSGAVTITGAHATHKLTATNGTASAGTNSITYVESVTSNTTTATSGDLAFTANRKTLSNIVTGSGLTDNTIILGNGSGGVKTSGKTVETSITANSDDKVPTSQAVASYISTQLGSLTGALVYKGTIASSGGTVTELPASHAVGDVYVVATAGTYAGKVCEVGDMVICNKAGTAASDSDWTVVNGENQVSQSNSEFTTDATSKAFAVVDGTILNLKVTHHTPSGGSAMSTTAGTAVGWSGAVITGLTSDGKGHITGVTTGTIPANPAGNGRMTISANAGTAVNTLFTANVSGATNAIDFTQGTGITTAVTAYSGTTPAKVTITHAAPGAGSAMTTSNGDASAATAGSTYAVITGVTVSKDGLGHITGISTTRQNIVSDSHHQAKNVVATTNAKTANEATANTTTFLNLVENGSVRSSHQIKGAGGVSVTSTAAGVITITGTTYTVNNATLSLQGTSGNATSTGFSANGNTNTTLKFAVTGSAVTGVTTTAASDGVATITIASASSLKNPNSFTVGTKASSTGTATNVVTYDGSASGKAIYFSTGAKSTTNVQFAVDANGFVTGTVNDSGNTASLKVSDATNRKISTTETSSKYIQFTGGTNKFTVTDGTSSFDVSVANGMEEITDAEINAICVL